MKKQIPIEEIIAFVLLLFLSIQTGQAQFVQAEQCLGGNGMDMFQKVIETPDGGTLIIVTTESTDGDFSDSHGLADIGLIKLNARHEIAWKKSIGTDSMDYYDNAVYIQDSRIILRYAATVGPNNWDYHYAILDLSGQLLHDININDLFNNTGFDSTYLSNSDPIHLICRNGDVILGGYQWSDTTFHIARINACNTLLWQDSIPLYEHYRQDTCTAEGYSHISVTPNIFELKNGSILFSVYLLDDSWGRCFNIHRFSDLYLYSSNGNLLQTGSLNYVNENQPNYLMFDRYHEDDTYFFMAISGAVARIDKNNLVNTYTLSDPEKSLIYNDPYDPIKYFMTQNTPVSIIKEDVYGNIYYQNWQDTLVPNLIEYFYIYPEYVKLIPEENALLILLDSDHGDSYSRDEKILLKIDSSGQTDFFKVFNGSLSTNYTLTTYSVCNYWYPQPCVINHIQDYPYVNYDNEKLYYYKLYKTGDFITDSIFQSITIIDTDDGDIIIRHNHDPLEHSQIFKYFLYKDENSALAISDLLGFQKCNLGGILDLSISSILLHNNNISARAFVDYNNNQVKEAGEPFFSLGYLQSDKGTQSVSNYLATNNFTTNLVDTGTWVSNIKPVSDYYTISPAPFATSHPEFGNSDTVIFALYPNQTVRDLKLSLVNTFVTRLGMEATYEITYVNNGTHPLPVR